MKLKKAVISQSIINGIIVSFVYCLLLYSNKNLVSLVVGLVLGTLIVAIYANIALKSSFMSGRDTLNQMKKAVFFKFFLNILAFIVIMCFYKYINFIPLFFSYLATLSSYWFVLLKK